jgi:hypothetical protein
MIKYVEPFDLEVDWTVDLDHVLALEKSIQNMDGIQQPVNVWSEGNLIVDGFHRVKAAQNLYKRGIKHQVPILVKVYTENEFWEMRVISARQHERITIDRIQDWIAKCWETDPHYEDSSYLGALDYFRSIVLHEEKKGFLSAYDEEEEGDFESLKNWVDDKARLWGLDAFDLADTLLKHRVKEHYGAISQRKLRFAKENWNSADLYTISGIINKWDEGVDTGNIQGGSMVEARRVMTGLKEGVLTLEDIERSGLEESSNYYFQTFEQPRYTEQREEREQRQTEDRRRSAVRQTLLMMKQINAAMEDYPDEFFKVGHTKNRFREEVVKMIYNASIIWGEPFDVWYRRIDPSGEKEN